jgi:hypothetical protein
MVKLKGLFLEKTLCGEMEIKMDTENSRMQGIAFHTICNLIQASSSDKVATE